MLETMQLLGFEDNDANFTFDFGFHGNAGQGHYL
jgi:hypothetical protein